MDARGQIGGIPKGKKSLKQGKLKLKHGQGVGGETDGESKLAVLKELGNQLQLKAERMRLLARAEEGLAEGDTNPYSPLAKSSKAESTVNQTFSVSPSSEMQSQSHISAARQRRRVKQTKPKQKVQSTVDIRQYKPGYHWNRGGRLKELRIRCIARKFSHHWAKKVFGRVRPSVARAHYNKRLTTITFAAWYDIWWEARKEWRLTVRAECHHRYVLWRKTFSGWRDFIVKKRVRNTKIVLAEQHGSCKVLRRYFRAWRQYRELCREKKKKKEVAIQHHSVVIVREMWDTWRHQHQLILDRQQMDMLALQFWAQRIQNQHWLKWRARISEKQGLILKHYRAVRHNNSVLVQSCWQAWLLYWARRRQKQREKEYGFAIYRRQLVMKTFCQWKDSLAVKQAMIEHEERINSLSVRFQLRMTFVRWLNYIEMVKEEKENMKAADIHHDYQLKKRGVTAFRICVLHQHLKVKRQEMADQHRQRQLMLQAWNHWLAGCENNEELRLLYLTRTARKHYNGVLCAKAFSQLQGYCAWRKHRQRQYARADAYYYMKAMPIYVFHMKVFVEVMKQQRENVQKAAEFREENVLARFFYLWCNKFEASKDYRMNERMAILHCDDRIIRRLFKDWKQKTHAAQEEAVNEEVAWEHYETVLCRSHLRAWKSNVEEIKQGRSNDITAMRHHCISKLGKCFAAWKQYTEDRRRKKEKTLRARNHYKIVVCRKMTTMWLHYVDIQRAVKQRVERKYQTKCQQLLSDALQTWRLNTAAEKQEKLAERQAIDQHTRSLLLKVLKTWQRYAAIHAYKKSETQQWVDSARHELQEGQLRRYFMRWREYYGQSVLDTEKCRQADQHRGHHVLTRVIQTWKVYTQESIRKSLLQKQGDWFHTVRLTARFYVRWKHAHLEAVQIQEKTHLALWHWCLNLQKKVMAAWLVYIQERKQKKERINAALERRRCRLLKDGVTQWLTVANDMSNMRAKFAAQQQAKSAFNTYQIVQHCALHWKHWAMKKRQERGRQLPTPRTTPHLPNNKQTVPHTKAKQTFPTSNLTPSFPVCKPALLPTDVQRKATPRLQPGTAELPAPVMTHFPARGSQPVSGPKPSADVQISLRAQQRARPRRPDFLVESLKRAGLYSSIIPTEHQQTTEDVRPMTTVLAHDPPQTDSNCVPSEIERLDLSHLSAQRSEVDDTPVLQHLKHGSSAVISKDVESENRHEPIYVIDNKPHPVTAGQFRPTTTTRLLTPADFMCKRDGHPILPGERQGQGDQLHTLAGGDHHFSEQFNVVFTETQSVASTPRVLCQDTSHSHPLSATYTFEDRGGYSIPNSREVTPRDTVLREVNVNNNVPKTSVQVGNSDKNTTQALQKEIVHIRNRLKSFDQKKKKIRTMEKQLRHLLDWLKTETDKGQSSDDTDITNARIEEQELEGDIQSLRRTVEVDEENCAGLVDRVKYLMSQIKR